MLEIFSTSWGCGTYEGKNISFCFADLIKEETNEEIVCQVMAYTNDGVSFQTVFRLMNDELNPEYIKQASNFEDIKEVVVNEVIFPKKNTMGDLTAWFEQIKWLSC